MAAMSENLRSTRVVFMGSPEFALPSLKALATESHVVGVVTQPDRPFGRGRKLKAPPVKELAQQLGLEVIQPAKLKEPEAFAHLVAWQPDLIVVAAFGQILRLNVLELPSCGCINVHASLLPRWRGAAPIQAAIQAGDKESGITIMKMDVGLDTGPIISQKAIPLAADETAGSLSEQLAALGSELLLETLPGYLAGEATLQEQDDQQSTYAPMLKREDGELDFSRSAAEIERQVRALHPWPGAFFKFEGQAIKVHRSSLGNGEGGEPGQFAVLEGYPAVRAGDAWLVLRELQVPGKRAMDGADYLRGSRAWEGRADQRPVKEPA